MDFSIAVAPQPSSKIWMSGPTFYPSCPSFVLDLRYDLFSERIGKNRWKVVIAWRHLFRVNRRYDWLRAIHDLSRCSFSFKQTLNNFQLTNDKKATHCSGKFTAENAFSFLILFLVISMEMLQVSGNPFTCFHFYWNILDGYTIAWTALFTNGSNTQFTAKHLESKKKFEVKWKLWNDSGMAPEAIHFQSFSRELNSSVSLVPILGYQHRRNSCSTLHNILAQCMRECMYNNVACAKISGNTGSKYQELVSIRNHLVLVRMTAHFGHFVSLLQCVRLIDLFHCIFRVRCCCRMAGNLQRTRTSSKMCQSQYWRTSASVCIGVPQPASGLNLTISFGHESHKLARSTEYRILKFYYYYYYLKRSASIRARPRALQISIDKWATHRQA